MGHYVIDVQTYSVRSARRVSASMYLQRMIRRLEETHGPLHQYRGDPEEAAERLSRSPVVARVVVTHVAETACGVWRRGRKS